MKNSFKVRVVENIGRNSQRLFGEVGNVISITDGEFEDLDGESWYYSSFDAMKDSFSNVDPYQTKIELVEDDMPNESKFLGTKSVESIVFDTDVLRKHQPIKIQGEFNGEDDVIINGIISYADEHSINIVHCDEDDDETMTTITTNEILTGAYKILHIYE